MLSDSRSTSSFCWKFLGCKKKHLLPFTNRSSSMLGWLLLGLSSVIVPVGWSGEVPIILIPRKRLHSRLLELSEGRQVMKLPNIFEVNRLSLRSLSEIWEQRPTGGFVWLQKDRACMNCSFSQWPLWIFHFSCGPDSLVAELVAQAPTTELPEDEGEETERKAMALQPPNPHSTPWRLKNFKELKHCFHGLSFSMYLL